MKFEIMFAPEAAKDFKHLSARERATIHNALEKHLRYSPEKVSISRIKRLQGLNHPQYRLRIGEIRVYYDVVNGMVEILALIPKSKATQ